MQELINFFNQGWVGSLIGVMGTAIGVFSYRISRSAPKPSFQRSALRLLGREEDNLPREVTIFFKGKEVDRLTKTTLIMWNDGTEVLEGKDVVEADPITIGFDDKDNILSFNVLKRTKDVNNVSFSQIEGHPHKLRLDFDYLDPRDGVVLEILHDSKKRYPKVTGTIKGLQNGFVDSGSVFSNRQFKANYRFRALGLLGRPKLIMWFTLALGLLMMIIGLLPQGAWEFLDNKGNAITPSDKTFFLIGGLLYLTLPVLFFWFGRRKYPAQLEFEEVES